MFLKKACEVVCKSCWVKSNSSCIVVVILVVDNIDICSVFLFDGAKVLLQTDKTCHKLIKKCTFFEKSAFF
jgi:hypothetical protein